MEKPLFLYHASKNPNIIVFEPRCESYRDPSEGPVIFATANKKYVSMFIVKTDDSWSRMGFFNDMPYFICSDKERFLSEDTGGAIYEVPSDTFSYDSEKGGKTRQEFTSKVSVKPISKVIYKSGLEAMLTMGVNVYFVDREKFQEITNSGDHGRSIIDKLTPEVISAS